MRELSESLWVCTSCGKAPKICTYMDEDYYCNHKEFVEYRKVDKENKTLTAIKALHEINAHDLDSCSVEELAQFHYWLTIHQGSIFVKTVGRLAVILESKNGGI